jgi:hypothetical protein
MSSYSWLFWLGHQSIYLSKASLALHTYIYIFVPLLYVGISSNDTTSGEFCLHLCTFFSKGVFLLAKGVVVVGFGSLL